MGQCDSISIQSSSYIRAGLNKKILNFEQVKPNCTYLAQGYHSNAYLYRQLNIVLKIMKIPSLTAMIKEIRILDHLKQIWSNLCEYQVLQNGKIIGFSIKYFQGQKIDLILQDKQNIYHNQKQSRVRLVKQLKILISSIQKLNICHGDIYLDNILIIQPDKGKEECEIIVIDFGNGFIFDKDTRTKAGLNGWKVMVPPEAKTWKKYDPKGANAYMFGRVALQILLLTTLSSYHLISEDPTFELNQLLRLGYDQSVKQQISGCFSEDLQFRSQVLMMPSLMKEKCLNCLEQQA